MPAWTSPELVRLALGPSAAPPVDDEYLSLAVDAANAWSYRKRREAGYDDPDADDAVAPSPDITYGATLYAVALWRERAAVDGYPSFSDLADFTPPGGSMGQIRRLLGIGRAAVDAPPDGTTLALLRRAPWSRWRW
jgi:hypothetical protein